MLMLFKRKAYPSDLSDADWERLKTLLPAAKALCVYDGLDIAHL